MYAMDSKNFKIICNNLFENLPLTILSDLFTVLGFRVLHTNKQLVL